MKNIFIAAVLALIVIVLVIVLFARGGGEPMASIPALPTGGPASPTISPSVSPTAVPSVVTVTYTDAGYSPSTVTVQAGTTVVFRNTSATEMWPASGIHPTHNLYPERGSCFADVFTGCNVAPGGTFSMKFNIVGTWQYHNHRTPQDTGTIIVQ